MFQTVFPSITMNSKLHIQRQEFVYILWILDCLHSARVDDKTREKFRLLQEIKPRLFSPSFFSDVMFIPKIFKMSNSLKTHIETDKPFLLDLKSHIF